MGYVAAAMVCVPLIIASLKSVTHVVCPSHLQIFGGEFAYLSIWQNMQAGTDAKCFPAAHASAGFALYAWTFAKFMAVSLAYCHSRHHTGVAYGWLQNANRRPFFEPHRGIDVFGMDDL